MKKLLLFFLALITLVNLSYASFPVSENVQTEVVQTIKSPTYSDSQTIWGVLSFCFMLLSLILLPNIFLTLISSLLGIIFGAIGFNKKLKGLAITAFILSLLVFILSLVFVAILLLYGGVGSAFGG